jgi:hypothetical protein
LQLERVRCGKASCRCADGELHGPYWYEYWSEAGKTRSRYVGKALSAADLEYSEAESDQLSV